MSSVRLEKRVEVLEAEVARLKAKVEVNAAGEKPWWEQMWGAFAGDAAFQQAMELGRKYRESQCPKRSPRKKR